MASKRILMLVGDFVEDYEAMVPVPDAADGRASRRRRVSRQAGRPNGAHGRPRLRGRSDLQRKAGPQLRARRPISTPSIRPTTTPW